MLGNSIKVPGEKQYAITRFFKPAESSNRKRSSEVTIGDSSPQRVKRLKVNLAENRIPSDSNAGSEEYCDNLMPDCCHTEDGIESNLIDASCIQKTAENESVSFSAFSHNQSMAKKTCLTNASGLSASAVEDAVVASSLHRTSTEMQSLECQHNSNLQQHSENTSGSIQAKSSKFTEELFGANFGKDRNSSSAVKLGNKSKSSSSKRERTNLPRPVDTDRNDSHRPQQSVGSLALDVDVDESSSDSLDLSYLLDKGSTSRKNQNMETKESAIPPKFEYKNAEKKFATLSFKTENSRVSRNVGQKNFDFYSNKIASSPNGAMVEDLLLSWKGDYSKLERHHGYIQWLFPISEAGLNIHAQPLTFEEAEFITTNGDARNRMKRAFILMLDFFGMELVDEEICTVKRAGNWKERFAHLNGSSHNYLRITRMLKCFVHVGQLQLQEAFIRFLVYEVFVKSTLTNCRRSCRDYWLPTVTSVAVKDELQRVIKLGRDNIIIKNRV